MKNLAQYNSSSVTVQLPTDKYIDYLMRMNCFEELLELFKDADSPTKELSESCSALKKLKKHTIISDSNWLHIGDGSRARTAALFSLLTKSLNISIDPLIRTDILEEWVDKWEVKRFMYEKGKIEDFKLPKNINSYNITCVHAHVDLHEIDEILPNWNYLYTSICCYPQKQKFSKNYMTNNNIILLENELDLGIKSEKREYAIYEKKMQ